MDYQHLYVVHVPNGKLLPAGYGEWIFSWLRVACRRAHPERFGITGFCSEPTLFHQSAHSWISMRSNGMHRHGPMKLSPSGIGPVFDGCSRQIHRATQDGCLGLSGTICNVANMQLLGCGSRLRLLTEPAV